MSCSLGRKNMQDHRKWEKKSKKKVIFQWKMELRKLFSREMTAGRSVVIIAITYPGLHSQDILEEFHEEKRLTWEKEKIAQRAFKGNIYKKTTDVVFWTEAQWTMENLLLIPQLHWRMGDAGLSGNVEKGDQRHWPSRTSYRCLNNIASNSFMWITDKKITMHMGFVAKGSGSHL